MRSTRVFFIMLIAMIFLVIGCSKKVTKTETPTEIPETQTKTTVEEATTAKEKAETEETSLKKEPLEFANVYFDFDKYELRKEARDLLAKHAKLLKDNPNVKLLIEGHCDERGTIEYNLALGERRANSVKRYLVDYGITANRFSTISYGKERPMVNGSDEAAWAKNRRAAFVIIEQ